LDSISIINSVQYESSGHGEKNPDHAEERGLETKEGHDQGKEGPQQLAHFEIE
jgi:hypothetical protein